MSLFSQNTASSNALLSKGTNSTQNLPTGEDTSSSSFGLNILDPSTKVDTMSPITKIPPVYQSNASTTDSHTKQILCLQMLCEGYVNSFVDFFYLSHKINDDVKTGALSQQHTLPESQMRIIKHHLTEAEAAIRHSDGNKVFESYDALAKYYMEVRDYATATYFYDKCLEYAETIGNLSQQILACNNLAIASDHMDNMDACMKHLEASRRIAVKLPDNAAVAYANTKLADVYLRKAVGYREKKENHKALEFYELALKSALGGNDSKYEAIAAYHIGIICKELGTYTEAQQWQERCLAIAKHTDHYNLACDAYFALADLARLQNDLRQATVHYEHCYTTAVRNNLMKTQIDACTNLGSVALEINQLEKAVVYFERAYEIAKQLKDRKLLDSARIHLGIAKGKLGLMKGKIDIGQHTHK